jgi:hypothetical protein
VIPIIPCIALDDPLVLSFAWQISFPADTFLRDTLLEFKRDPEQILVPTVSLSNVFLDPPMAKQLHVLVVHRKLPGAWLISFAHVNN